MALSEREYMGARGRAFQSRFALTTTRILVAANAVAFFFQELAGGIGGEGAVMSYLPLSQSAISHGALWTFVTYSFLHDNLFHLLANMLTLWCTGNFLEPAESRSRILVLYFGGVLAGAFLWYPVGGQARLIGASAGVCATMAYMLLRHFHDTFRLLLPPIVMRAKWMLAFLTVITLSGFLFAEIPTAFPSSWWPALWKNETAHSAHLGGLLWGTGIFALGRWFFSQTDNPFPAGRLCSPRVAKCYCPPFSKAAAAPARTAMLTNAGISRRGVQHPRKSVQTKFVVRTSALCLYAKACKKRRNPCRAS